MEWARDARDGNGDWPTSPRLRLLSRLSADSRLSRDAIEAIARVPREVFVPARHADLAYEDVALEIGPDATISAPSMVAEMLSVLELKPGMKVLEIGAGSGYAAAAMAALGGQVIGVELQPELAETARHNLGASGFSEQVRIVAADGRDGRPTEAPYDRILVSAAVEAIPHAWLGQLKDGGMIVYPEAGPGEDRLIRLTFKGGDIKREVMGLCRFVRMRL